MIFKEDIIKRIQTDFGMESNKAIEILNQAIHKTDYLNLDRIIRCIVFESKGNLNDLQKNIKAATNDPRDIMLWAEYEKLSDNFNYKRIRDFNKTFEESTINVRE
jgi:galactose-1-phosphate uridylyltransferase